MFEMLMDIKLIRLELDQRDHSEMNVLHGHQVLSKNSLQYRSASIVLRYLLMQT